MRWLLAPTLALLVATHTACSECDDGLVNVCDEEGESCSCVIECTAHLDCVSGEFCADAIDACVPLQPQQAAGPFACGGALEPCCSLSTDRGLALVCLDGLACDGTFCVPR